MVLIRTCLPAGLDAPLTIPDSLLLRAKLAYLLANVQQDRQNVQAFNTQELCRDGC
jgi:hypothetical protein